MSTPPISVAVLGDLLADPYVHEEGPAVLAVELGSTPPTTAPELVSAWVERLRSLPTVSVGVLGDRSPPAAQELAEGFDILLATSSPGGDAALETEDPDAAITQIVEAVQGNPVAAATAARLLRLTPWRDTSAGLIVESLAYSTLQSGPEFGTWLRERGAAGAPVEADGETGTRVRSERHHGTLRLTLSRPRRHNAYDARTRDELVEQLRAAALDPALDGVVLAGDGPSFCSGGDLAEFGSFTDPATGHDIRTRRSAAYWLDNLAAKVRVELHGACIGAGIELAAYCGSVLAAPDTRITLPEVGLGLVPGAGGTVSIPRRIGRQRTCWLALTGATIDASTARGWGLVDRITP